MEYDNAEVNERNGDEPEPVQASFNESGANSWFELQQLFEQAKELPFLKGAKPAVVNVFRQVLEDPEIPSEQRRMDEVKWRTWT